MTDRKRKLVVLGLDAAVPKLVDQFTEAGSMPNLKWLIDNGVYARHITTFPTLTSPAWSAISTGAAIGTAGIPSLTVKVPGEPLNTVRSCFDSRFLEAETLWEAGSAVGKRSVLVNWPVTQPPKATPGVVQIAGSINPPFRFYYLPIFDLSPSSVYSTTVLPCDQVPDRAKVIAFRDVNGRKTCEICVPANGKFFNGMKYGPRPLPGKGRRYQVEWNPGEGTVVIRASESGVVVARLREGETSDWVRETFEFDGSERRGQFRFHLT